MNLINLSSDQALCSGFVHRLRHRYYRYMVPRIWEKETRSKPLGACETIRDTNSSPVDIVIPALPKDLPVLELAITGVRKFLVNPIGRIYIVSPDIPDVKRFCDDHDCDFFNEQELPVLKPSQIAYRCQGTDRSNWLFQQLIKLGGTVGENNWYFVIDADTVLIRPLVVRQGDIHLFYQLPTIHLPYRYSYHKVLGERTPKVLTFVSHMMVFEKTHIKNMHRAIEEFTGLRWDQGIVSCIDQNELSSFSDYETYGSYVCNRESVLTFPSYNIELGREKLCDFDSLVSLYQGNYSNVSFHSWIGKW